MKEKIVYIIFKTHLDIGYTDYAANIIDKYLTCYIPNAIKLGYELKESATPFKWTLSSWMIDKALTFDKEGIIKKAIEDGILHWHALPYTSHTELESPALFEYGLSISEELDRKFGKKTIAAKMTDVPGHTIAMVPYLKRHGIKFLHIGTNEASAVPKVPEVFNWKYGEDSVIVMYHSAYGAVSEFEDFVVYFAHTNDNTGPQSKEEIIEIFTEAQKRFPGCKICCATLDDVAERLSEIHDLPIIENEIGDTWIHGAATDPEKLSRYRNVLRHLKNKDVSKYNLKDNLLLVPEHTWGLSSGRLVGLDYYTHRELPKLGAEMISIYEASWEEQRKYVKESENLLGITPEYPMSLPSLDGFCSCDIEEPPFEISWQLYSNEDFEVYKKEYMRLTEENSFWAIRDYTKKGLPDYESLTLIAKVKECYIKGKTKIYKLEFDEVSTEEYGLPYFYAQIDENYISIKWFGKKASRLPQAFWLKFKGFTEDWEIEKLGSWIKVGNWLGSPLISGIGKGIRNKEYMIESLDAGVVAPFGRMLYRFGYDNKVEDMYFNLYNNEWNTNFPFWYSDDAMFRFKISKL